MLKVRLIPTLLWKDVGLVKGIKFDSWRRVGTVLPAIKVYNTRDVDELILLDITATPEKHELDYDSIEEFSSECFVPLTVGGGVDDIDKVQILLQCGADKVTINSAAYDNPQLIADAANRFGSQCIVASIDAQKNLAGSHECVSHCGTRAQGRAPGEWAAELEKLGAGEILITSVEQDGTMQGYDLDLIQQITKAVSLPVIAAGGAGSPDDMFQAIYESHASAVAAASLFHFTELTPAECKTYLAGKGIPVRK